MSRRVLRNAASDSPGNPTMTSVTRPMSGMRERAASLWVVVVVDVLAEKNDLPGAGCDRLPGLGQHSLDGDVALAAAHARHDAESAVVVAALDDADVVADAGAAGPWQRLPK